MILEKDIIEELLNDREKFYIKLHDSFINGYNGTEGGDGGGHWIHDKTEEEKMVIAKKKSNKLTGRVFSEETIKKMSDSVKKKFFTKEHRENIGKAVKLRGGIPHTQETKNKLSEIKMGIKNPEHSKFMKKNNPNFKSVSIEGITYISIVEACNVLGIKRGTVKYRLNSKNFINWFKIK